MDETREAEDAPGAAGHGRFGFQLVLEHGDVVMVPGTPFGAPGYVRLSFACSIEELEKAIDRIKAALV